MFTPGRNSLPNQVLRAIGQFVDKFLYWLLNFIFKIFFQLCNAEYLDNDIVNTLFNNIQLLLSILITFKISFSLITYIIDPDKANDAKVGAKKLILNIMLVLSLLTALIPMSGIPKQDTITSDGESRNYNFYLKTNGILFGAMYYLQDRILAQNIIPKLVLGSESNNDTSIQSQSSIFTSTIIKSFVTPNLKDGKCIDDNDPILIEYNETHSYKKVIDVYAEKTCGGEDSYYMFNYMPLASLLCAGILIFIVAGFCIDVAIRFIKLILLRIIAPIPIISLLTPSKSETFNSWLKMTLKTYADLFLRIAVIYFIVDLCLIINDITDSDLGLDTFGKIVLYIGLFVFAKQAPKFFMDMFGIKSDGGLFSNIGALAGIGAFVGGALGSGIGGAIRGYNNSIDNPNNKSKGFMRNVRAGFRGLGAGLSNTVGGAASGVTGAWGAKDGHYSNAILSSQAARNNLAAQGSSFLGRRKNDLSNILLGGYSGDAALQNKIDRLNSDKSTYQGIMDFASGEVEKGKVNGNFDDFRDHSGNSLSNVLFNYKQSHIHAESARSAGRETFTLTDVNGNTHVVNTDDYFNKEYELKDNATDRFIKTIFSPSASRDTKQQMFYDEATRSGLNISDLQTIKSNINQIDSDISRNKYQMQNKKRNNNK